MKRKHCWTIFLLWVFALNGFAQDTLLFQGWEGLSYLRVNGQKSYLSDTGLMGFQQYNNRTSAFQNVWARNGIFGINECQDSVFKTANGVDTILPVTPANYRGFSGVHIITNRYTAENQRISAYHAGCDSLLGCDSLNNAETSVGLYSPAIDVRGYTHLKASFWYKCAGDFNHDYGLFRYSLATNILPPLPDSADATAPDSIWKTMIPDGHIPDSSSIEPGQLSENLTWKKISYSFPNSFDHTQNLSLAFWWINDNDGTAHFPGLITDDLVLQGFEFRTLNPSTLTFCQGATIDLPFRCSGGLFTSGNIFYVQLSDINGSFAHPDTIGVLNSLSCGTILAKLPISKPSGSGYKLRVVATTPQTVSLEMPGVLTISETPALTISTNGILCSEDQPVLKPSIQQAQTYQWFRDGLPISNADTLKVTVPGVYHLRVTLNNCTIQSNTITVANSPIVTFRINQDTFCVGGAPYQLTGGLPLGGKYYGPGVTNGGMFIPFNAGVGIHALLYRYTNNQNCTAENIVTIWVLPLPSASVLADSGTTACAGNTKTLRLSNNNFDAVLWSNGETTPTITVTQNGIYSAQLVSNLGCNANTDSVTITFTPRDTAQAPSIDSITLRVTTTAQFIYGRTNGGHKIFIYRNNERIGEAIIGFEGDWSFELPINLQPGDYFYAKGSSDTNCDGLVTEVDALSPSSNVVYVVPDDNVAIPSGFSPNGDNINDTWEVFTPQQAARFPNTSVTVVNRWGTVVFKSDNYNNNWDGGGLPDGVYFYTIDIKQLNRIFKGSLTILR